MSILIIIVCALLILIVLVQNSKGGGLSSSFAANNQIMGVRKTADFLEKATWGFALALFIFSLLATPKRQVPGEGPDAGTESVTRKKQEGMVTVPATVPQAPAGAQGAANPGAGATQQQPQSNPPAGK